MFAPEVAVAAGEAVGGGIGGMFAAAGTYVAESGAAGGAATVLGNILTCHDATARIGFGIEIGAFAPLASGEAAMIGAGGAAAFDGTIANGFGAFTGAIGAIAAAMYPNSRYGFWPKIRMASIVHRP